MIDHEINLIAQKETYDYRKIIDSSRKIKKMLKEQCVDKFKIKNELVTSSVYK